MNTPVHTHLTHEVEDFGTWKQVFDQGQPLRDKHSIKINGVYQAHDNPNMVTVHAEMADPQALQNFMADPQGQADMQKAGVKGRPEMKMLHKHS